MPVLWLWTRPSIVPLGALRPTDPFRPGAPTDAHLRCGLGRSNVVRLGRPWFVDIFRLRLPTSFGNDVVRDQILRVLTSGELREIDVSSTSPTQICVRGVACEMLLSSCSCCVSGLRGHHPENPENPEKAEKSRKSMVARYCIVSKSTRLMLLSIFPALASLFPSSPSDSPPSSVSSCKNTSTTGVTDVPSLSGLSLSADAGGLSSGTANCADLPVLAPLWVFSRNHPTVIFYPLLPLKLAAISSEIFWVVAPSKCTFRCSLLVFLVASVLPCATFWSGL